jgi:CRP-like cAMP-binding protein
MTARDILGATPFFSEVLDAAALDRLARNVSEVRFDRDAVLLSEDDSGHSMLVIASGEVAVSVPGSDGARRIATLGPGAIVGEMSLMTGARRSATVTALAPVAAIEIDKSALEPILAGSPQLVDRFAEMLDRRQAELDRVYGAGTWNIFGLGGGDMRSLISTFFGGLY